MLFNPTPLEKLTTLTNDMAAKYKTIKGELDALKEEIATSSAYSSAQEEEIVQLTEALRLKEQELTVKNSELAEKDSEIEAIIAKIESMLG